MPPETRHPSISYMLACGVRAGERPPVSVRSRKSDGGWSAAITWPREIGGADIAWTPEFGTRQEALIALRDHLRQRHSTERGR